MVKKKVVRMDNIIYYLQILKNKKGVIYKVNVLHRKEKEFYKGSLFTCYQLLNFYNGKNKNTD